jgi:hypothetical protein
MRVGGNEFHWRNSPSAIARSFEFREPTLIST